MWAVIPPIAMCLVEKIAFNTTCLSSTLNEYLPQSFTEAFAYDADDSQRTGHLFQLDRVKMLTSPDLWIGLGVAVAFLAAAVWLRRNREPV